MQKLKNHTKSLIINSFEIDTLDTITEKELEEMLAARVEDLLAHRLEFFFAAMYRMDVKEDTIHHLLANDPKPAQAIARLIIQRQKEKQASRDKYRSETDDLWDF